MRSEWFAWPSKRKDVLADYGAHYTHDAAIEAHRAEQASLLRSPRRQIILNCSR
jgi:hypothetical protein